MERPTSVTVFGVLCILFGALVLCCSPVALAGQFLPRMTNTGNAPDFNAVMMSTPFLRGYTVGSMLVGFLFATVELAAGIGLMRSRPWGRMLAIGYGVAAILLALVSTVISIVFITPVVQEAAQQIKDPAVRSVMTLTPYLTVIGTCAGLLFPILLLIFMNRPSVKEYFAAIRMGAAAESSAQPTDRSSAPYDGESPAP